MTKKAFKRFLLANEIKQDHPEYTQEQIAKLVGVSSSRISHYLSGTSADIPKEYTDSRVIDLTGKTFGKLLVVGRGDRPLGYNGSYRATFWDVVCECGFQKTLPAQSLVTGKTKSCGRGCRVVAQRAGENSRRGPRLIDDNRVSALVHRVHNKYRESANKRGYVFALTEKDVSELILSSCYYCGNGGRIYESETRYGIPRVGIDRVDNSIGYIKTNCVSCCFICNKAKGEMSTSDFISWAKAVADRF